MLSGITTQQKLRALPNKHILFLFLGMDLLFFAMHFLRSLPGIDLIPILEEGAFSIAEDHSLGEAFQYVKEFWIVLLLGLLVFRFGKKTFWGWMLFFLYILLDDMLKIHESVGDLGSQYFQLPTAWDEFERLRGDDIVELAYLALSGGIILLILILLYIQSNSEIRAIQRPILFLFAALIAFGVGVDFIDRFANSEIILFLLKFIEDGGEMIVMSVICWYAFFIHDKYAGQQSQLSAA